MSDDVLLGGLMGIFAVLGFALSVLVLRADPKRWDNRVFAAMCFTDALIEATRSAHLLDGSTLMDTPLLRACLIGNLIIALLTLEFAYSFPFNRQMPAKLRAIPLLATIAAVILVLIPATRETFIAYASFVFFLPFFAATLYLLRLNLKRLTGNVDFLGIPLVMLSLAGRWISGMATFLIAKRIGPEAFDSMLLFDSTVAIFISYALLAYALLKYHLFRVRGVIADVVLHGGGVVTTLVLLWMGIDLVLTRVPGPVLQRALLVGVALVPSGIIAAARYVLPKIEEAIICPIDPRRALVKGVLENVVHQTAGKIDARSVLDVTLASIVEVTGGGKASFASGPTSSAISDAPALGPALARHLASMRDLHLHRPHAHGLEPDARRELEAQPAELFVPVRRGEKLFGAIMVEGGEQDRDSVRTAVAAADHLALKLENYDLFGQMLSLTTELEESRRLAALGSFAAAIAHDLRTPLTSVQMNVQILRGKAKLPPDDMEYFDIALEELKRLNAHISELLDYAKPVQVKASPIDLREIADDAVKGLEPILFDRELRLEKEYAEVPHVLADAGRIRQVLLNLLENAAQATTKGGEIKLRTRADNGHIALDVADTGRGIEAEHLAKIFEPFFTTKADGTGLGLAIAQKLVRAHGGEIRVRSTIGEGSTFTILLPAVAAASVEA